MKMSKEYVMQLEATIANLRRDNQLLKERLEAIDSANPSEALECLERLDISFRYSTIDDEGYSLKEPRKMINICDKEFNTIKQALIKAQEQEKVLSIIKETKIDVNKFQTSLMIMSNFTYKYYINNSRDYHTCIMVKLLTEEEFDVLKRWVG